MKKSILFALLASVAALAPAADDKPGFVKVTWSEDAGEKWEVQGLADREAGRPMATNTVFAICSNTKTVTAILALTFVEDGTISFDDPVTKYFPEFDNFKFKGEKPKTPITLRMLLSHMSGLPYSISAKGRKSDMTSYLEQIKIATDKGELRAMPGVAYQYCGFGFQVMGAILEKVTGRKASDLMKERVFDPLGMNDTTFYPDAEMMARAAIPYYHPPKGGAPVRYDFENRCTPPYDNPARTAMLSGGLASTVPDFLKFAQMMALKGKGVNGKRVVSEKIFEEYMITRQTPPGDKVDSSFDCHFDKAHAGGSKGGLFATGANWNWAKRSCSVTFRAKSPYAPKGMKSAIDASGFGGKKTTFAVSEIKVAGGKASCRVANNEDRHGVGTVLLLVNGKPAAKKKVDLAIGEAKTVVFDFTPKDGEKVTFSAK